MKTTISFCFRNLIPPKWLYEDNDESTQDCKEYVTWSHYRFRQRLLNKSREYPWCSIIICDEAYTSKTCGECGFIHNKLGGSKVFDCPQCGEVQDRDMNGARNILLRYETLNYNREVDHPDMVYNNTKLSSSKMNDEPVSMAGVEAFLRQRAS